MTDRPMNDVIIIGGSYAGLSAALTLGRSLRRVLIIDSGAPCNRTAPQAHNFLTHDGERPAAIAATAREQVLRYPTVSLLEGWAEAGERTADGFAVRLRNGERHEARKLVLASGVKDLMPPIEGFAACWGISVVHCPYCHGYEVRNKATGVLANGDVLVHYAPLLRNLTAHLTALTNGPASFNGEQRAKLQAHGIALIEKEVRAVAHENGRLHHVVFTDGSTHALAALYHPTAFEQHSPVPRSLGCAFTEHGHIRVDEAQRTSIEGVFACGDSASPMRSVSYAVASGTLTGATINHSLAEAAF